MLVHEYCALAPLRYRAYESIHTLSLPFRWKVILFNVITSPLLGYTRDTLGSVTSIGSCNTIDILLG